MLSAQQSSRSDRKGGARRSASAALGNPAQIFGQSTRDWNENYFWDFVCMKRAQFFLKCGLSIFAQLEEDERLIAGFDFFFPTIDRFHARQNVCARSELFCDQLF